MVRGDEYNGEKERDQDSFGNTYGALYTFGISFVDKDFRVESTGS